MTSTTVPRAMRDRALAMASEIIRLAQTTAENYQDGYDLSLAMLRGTDPFAYKEMLDAVIVLEAQGLAQPRQQALCTFYAVRRQP
jgi:hypothetical protein